MAEHATSPHTGTKSGTLRQLCVRIPAALRTQVRRAVVDGDTTIQTFVCQALRAQLRHHRTAFLARHTNGRDADVLEWSASPSGHVAGTYTRVRLAAAGDSQAACAEQRTYALSGMQDGNRIRFHGITGVLPDFDATVDGDALTLSAPLPTGHRRLASADPTAVDDLLLRHLTRGPEPAADPAAASARRHAI